MELEHPNEIHSKLIMNESQALFGSLNLTEASALAQASELCLRTTDPVLMQNFRNYFQMLKEEATFKK
jgi:hypothetical protein